MAVGLFAREDKALRRLLMWIRLHQSGPRRRIPNQTISGSSSGLRSLTPLVLRAGPIRRQRSLRRLPGLKGLKDVPSVLQCPIPGRTGPRRLPGSKDLREAPSVLRRPMPDRTDPRRLPGSKDLREAPSVLRRPIPDRTNPHNLPGSKDLKGVPSVLRLPIPSQTGRNLEAPLARRVEEDKSQARKGTKVRTESSQGKLSSISAIRKGAISWFPFSFAGLRADESIRITLKTESISLLQSLTPVSSAGVTAQPEYSQLVRTTNRDRRNLVGAVRWLAELNE